MTDAPTHRNSEEIASAAIAKLAADPSYEAVKLPGVSTPLYRPKISNGVIAFGSGIIPDV
jgi:hypothetical protein